uniref:Zgc:92429 n=1 Tax=Oncorhynchus mykiss TaxID=8022 RepID=A0A8K9WU18_ONCMY
NMALCYNKGCGEKFDADKNKDDACLHHPGVPIFHDALKGWSCCRKRTTDFSEFLSIKGCTQGRHSNEKPQEPMQPTVTSDKNGVRNNREEIIYQGPKSAEALQKERPSSDEDKTKLKLKVSASLTQVLEKMEISSKAELKKKGVCVCVSLPYLLCLVSPCCSNRWYKYWGCCCVKTIDFNAFLDQKGCTNGKHRWVQKVNNKKVACRHDWHQTATQVYVTIYAKNANPELSYVEANRTVVRMGYTHTHTHERRHTRTPTLNSDVANSGVNMVSSKVEVSLRKADAVAWGKLEDPKFKPEPEPQDLDMGTVNIPLYVVLSCDL